MRFVGIPPVPCRGYNQAVMTAEAKHIVDDFRSLPDAAKREVLAELVRISGRIEYPPISDDELLAAANDVFLAYDEREDE